MANGLIGGFGTFGQGQQQGNLLGGVFQPQPTRGQRRAGLISNAIQQYGGNAQQTGGAAVGSLLGLAGRAAAEKFGLVDAPPEVQRSEAIRQVQQEAADRGLNIVDDPRGFGDFVAGRFQELGQPDLANRSLIETRKLESQLAPEPVETERVVSGDSQIGQQLGLGQGETAIASFTDGVPTGIKDRQVPDEPEVPSIIRQYNIAKQQGLIDENTSFTDFRSQTVPGTGPQIGTIPSGFQLTDVGGSFRLEPIPGSEAEKEREQAQKQAEEREDLAGRAAGVVFEDISRLENLITNDSLLNPVLGLKGLAASQIPGTSRVDAEALAETVKANIGFDRLQQMREASPTGGALGQVSNQELNTLQAVLGNLSFSQSQENLERNLGRLKTIYSDILKTANAYPNAEEFGFGTLPENIDSDLGEGASENRNNGQMSFQNMTVEGMLGVDLDSLSESQLQEYNRRLDSLIEGAQ